MPSVAWTGRHQEDQVGAIQTDGPSRTPPMNLRLSLLMVGAAFAASCAGGGEPSSNAMADSVSVSLEAIAFSPAELMITTGTTVTWINRDEGVAHTVTSGTPKKQGVPGLTKDRPGKPNGLFDKELPDAGDTYQVTFEEPGTFRYYCAIHAPMTGTIVVE